MYKNSWVFLSFKSYYNKVLIGTGMGFTPLSLVIHMFAEEETITINMFIVS